MLFNRNYNDILKGHYSFVHLLYMLIPRHDKFHNNIDLSKVSLSVCVSNV